jgi:two-component system response regulator CpxR
MRTVLIVDDDVKLTEMLREYLAQRNIRLGVQHDGEKGLEAALSGRYELVLLDVMLPGIDGFEMLRRLRMSSDLCVLLLTARGGSADRIHGLKLGADDYLPKPFDPEELVARMGAILRRRSPQLAPAPASFSGRKLQRGGLTIDCASRTVSYGDITLDLTAIELSLLETFVQSPGVVLSREDLVTRVFQRPFHPLDRSLDMYVSRLRRKLLSATPLGNQIKTIRSAGYLFSMGDPSC